MDDVDIDKILINNKIPLNNFFFKYFIGHKNNLKIIYKNECIYKMI